MSETLYADPIPCDTVFLLGAGAITNAWVPVIQALREFRPHAEITTGEQANFVLAQWVYHQRSRALRLAMDDVIEEDRETARRVERQDLRLRQNIAAHIRVAAEQDFYGVRRGLVPLLHNPQWGERRFIITTNWDRALETDLGFRRESVIHIHGDVEVPSLLYLPTETAAEPYRSREQNAQVAAHTSSAVRIIQGAKQLCIYGLSLSPLDAELNVVLGVGLEPREGPPVPIYVCNLKEAVSETAWRVRAALDGVANTRIGEVEVERENDPPVPPGWDLWVR
jgi:hypothetical protein